MVPVGQDVSSDCRHIDHTTLAEDSGGFSHFFEEIIDWGESLDSVVHDEIIHVFRSKLLDQVFNTLLLLHSLWLLFQGRRHIEQGILTVVLQFVRSIQHEDVVFYFHIINSRVVLIVELGQFHELFN